VVEDGNDLLRVLDQLAPGDKVELTVNRGGSVRELNVRLGELQ
jgi:S1-C subfamily serine protease